MKRPHALFVAAFVATTVLYFQGVADADSATLEAQGAALCAIAGSLPILTTFGDETTNWCASGSATVPTSDSSSWCSWNGVTCDATYLVTSIDIGADLSAHLVGTIPASISTLTSLTKLDMSTNYITGTLPSQLSALTGLTYLNLASNYITGPIPSTISTLTNLVTLNLDGTFLTGTVPSVFMGLAGYTAPSTTNPASILAQGQVLCAMFNIGLGGLASPWFTCDGRKAGGTRGDSAAQYQKVSGRWK